MSSQQKAPGAPQTLENMSVLITRPEHQQASLSQSIESRGGRVASLPLLKIEPLTDKKREQKTRTLIQNLDQYQWLIFVSSNAARLGAQLVDDYWPQFPVAVKMAAIGRTTKLTLESILNQPVLTPPQGSDSEALLGLAELSNVAGMRIAIFRGIGGRELLANTLEERGAEVHYVELYTRSPVAHEKTAVARLLADQAVNTVTVHSGESLTHLAQLLNDGKIEFYTMPLIVPSNRVAEQAKELGFRQVMSANGADDESMLEALQNVQLNADITE